LQWVRVVRSIEKRQRYCKCSFIIYKHHESDNFAW
jgi:hypothetical protein